MQLNMFGVASRVDPLSVANARTTALGAGGRSGRETAMATAAAAAKSEPAPTFDAGSVLGKDDFLKLLVTQLTYQDPIDPVADTEFIAQLAQFSSLEQMHNVGEQVGRLADAQVMLGGMGQAASLLGREVSVLHPESGERVQGTVEAARFVDGVPVLVVDGHSYSLWDVLEVRE